jgi:chromosome segregation ATPase
MRSKLNKLKRDLEKVINKKSKRSTRKRSTRKRSTRKRSTRKRSTRNRSTRFGAIEKLDLDQLEDGLKNLKENLKDPDNQKNKEEINEKIKQVKNILEMTKEVHKLGSNTIEKNKKRIEQIDKEIIKLNEKSEKSEKENEKLKEIQTEKTKLERINNELPGLLNQLQSVANNPDVDKEDVYKRLRRITTLCGGISNSSKYYGEVKATQYSNLVQSSAVVGAVGLGGVTLYKHIKRKMLNPLKEKLDTLKQKFKVCKIVYEKSKYTYVNDPLDYVKETVNNLESALSGNKFGSEPEAQDQNFTKDELKEMKKENRDNLVKNNLSKHALIATGVAAGAGGIRTFILKKQINGLNKRIDKISEQLKSVCKESF